MASNVRHILISFTDNASSSSEATDEQKKVAKLPPTRSTRSGRAELRPKIPSQLSQKKSPRIPEAPLTADL